MTVTERNSVGLTSPDDGLRVTAVRITTPMIDGENWEPQVRLTGGALGAEAADLAEHARTFASYAEALACWKATRNGLRDRARKEGAVEMWIKM